MVIRGSGRHSARRSEYGGLGVTMLGKADMDLKICQTTGRAGGDQWAAHPPPFTLLAASSFIINHPSLALLPEPQQATFTQDTTTTKGIGDRRATKQQHHHAFASEWDYRNGFARRRSLP